MPGSPDLPGVGRRPAPIRYLVERSYSDPWPPTHRGDDCDAPHPTMLGHYCHKRFGHDEWDSDQQFPSHGPRHTCYDGRREHSWDFTEDEKANLTLAVIGGWNLERVVVLASDEKEAK